MKQAKIEIKINIVCVFYNRNKSYVSKMKIEQLSLTMMQPVLFDLLLMKFYGIFFCLFFWVFFVFVELTVLLLFKKDKFVTRNIIWNDSSTRVPRCFAWFVFFFLFFCFFFVYKFIKRGAIFVWNFDKIGYNGTVFAYGQTGSGKTYTIVGPEG